MEQIFSLLSGGLGGAILVWLFRSWITERLKQSINYEYSEKLESYKTDLNTKIQEIQHENQINQLRTSLFFDHQRNAFASLLAKIAEVNKKWFESYEPDNEHIGPVPNNTYQELEALYYEHQLFLDDHCIMAMELLLESYSCTLTFWHLGEPPDNNELLSAYSHVEYLQPLIASIFRQKIGVMGNSTAVREIALFGAMSLINKFHFSEIELPPNGNLQIKHDEQPSYVVVKAEEHIEELLNKLMEFDEFLSKEDGVFHEAQLKLRKYIPILNTDKKPNNSINLNR